MWVLLIMLFVFSHLSNHELAFQWLFDSMLFIEIYMVNTNGKKLKYNLRLFFKQLGKIKCIT